MYESHFGLSRRPFSAAPDPMGFVDFAAVRDHLQELFQCLKSGPGIAVLTGAPGTGKTLICRKLAADLNGPFHAVFLANANYPTRRSLLQAILYELGHPYLHRDEPEFRLEVFSAIKSAWASGGTSGRGTPTALIVDEAHLLSDELLEELRAITNLTDDGQPLVRLLLSGQWELEEKLTDPQLTALNQRIACQVTLEPLSQQESAEYIAARLKFANAQLTDVFTPQAVRLICHASDGIPRCLNLLCDHSLLLGYVAGQRPLTVDVVREALDDLKQLPLHWNIPSSWERLQEASPEPDAEHHPEPASDVTGLRDASERSPAEHSSIEVGSEETETEEPLPVHHPSSETIAVRDVEEPTPNETGAVIEVGADEGPASFESLPSDPVPSMDEFPSREDSPPDAPEEDSPPEEWIPAPFGIPDGDGWRSPEDPVDDERARRRTPTKTVQDSAGPAESEGPFEEAPFDEEVVVDHYARLDADSSWTWAGPSRPQTVQPSADSDVSEQHERVRRPEPSTGGGDETPRPSLWSRPATPTVELETRDAEQQSPQFLSSNSAEESAETAPPREARPDEILAQMNPWLKAALETDSSPTSPPDSGDSAGWDEPSQLVGWPLENPAESLEERLGAEVFDVCLDTHEAVENSPSEPENHGAEADAFPQPSQPFPQTDAEGAWADFDVVQPEPDSPGEADSSSIRGSSSGSSSMDAAQTARQYKYLYNELRPRHRSL